MALREVFHSPPPETGGGFLFLPGEVASWTLNTEAFFPALDDEGEIMVEDQKASPDLQEVLDLQSIEDVVAWADRLAGEPNDDVRFESFIYYYRFDAFLPKVGASDPPPLEAITQKEELEFYDGLGPERADKPCSEKGCIRGSVRFSVLCRPHHFRSMKNKECPFNH